jgi:hypothetical protein
MLIGGLDAPLLAPLIVVFRILAISLLVLVVLVLGISVEPELLSDSWEHVVEEFPSFPP